MPSSASSAFSTTSRSNERNWQGPGILLDLGDYNTPVDKWFPGRAAYQPPVSADVLVDWSAAQEEAAREWNRKEALLDREDESAEHEKLAGQQEFALEETARYVEQDELRDTVAMEPTPLQDKTRNTTNITLELHYLHYYFCT